MSARGGKKRQKAMSKSQRANVTFPVGRLHRYLKMGTHRLRIGVGSPVYMAAVIEYLTGMTRQRKLDLKKYGKVYV
jgi:histone H2A